MEAFSLLIPASVPLQPKGNNQELASYRIPHVEFLCLLFCYKAGKAFGFYKVQVTGLGHSDFLPVFRSLVNKHNYELLLQ